MKRLTCLILAIAALGLSACGMRGNLERPPPLWGEPAPEEQSDSDE